MTKLDTDQERRRYHHGDLRAALIEATIALLAERRAEDVSVADAARAAGVSTAAPYRHFRDKEDLLAQVSAEGFRRLGEATSAASARHPPGSVDELIAGGCAYIEFGAANPELFHVMWGAARWVTKSDSAHRVAHDCYGHFIGTLERVLAAEGLDHLDPDAFGAPLWAMVHGFASLLIAENEMLDREKSAIRQRVDDATRAYIAGVRAGLTRLPERKA